MTRLQPVSNDLDNVQEMLKPNISHVDSSKV